jgi:hypothetical protein
MAAVGAAGERKGRRADSVDGGFRERKQFLPEAEAAPLRSCHTSLTRAFDPPQSAGLTGQIGWVTSTAKGDCSASNLGHWEARASVPGRVWADAMGRRRPRWCDAVG